MCGILGIYNLDGAPVHSGLVKEMAQTFAHRGPDGEGYYTDGGLALAHKCLTILDTSPRAAQPMSSKSGTWKLVLDLRFLIHSCWNSKSAIDVGVIIPTYNPYEGYGLKE